MRNRNSLIQSMQRRRRSFSTTQLNAELQTLAQRESAMRDAAVALQNAVFVISNVNNFTRVSTLARPPFTEVMTLFILGTILNSADAQQKQSAIARYQARLQELSQKLNELCGELNEKR